ncbi:MAG: hypothetical protein JJU11_15065 [Candidatus Sumerlaeia bacterium]|nr:hypothetical protein [Candidatus Sumerlaeia bacterium]
MARKKETWSFRIVATFGPGDLLRLGNAIAGDTRFRDAELTYDFDWMKRRLAFTANTEEAATQACGMLISRVEKKAGPDQLLAGKPETGADGRVTIPMGVILQEPEVFRELMVGGLYEAGLMGITQDPNDGGHFLIRPKGPAASLPWRDLITEFPLPPYLKLEERIIEDEK